MSDGVLSQEEIDALLRSDSLTKDSGDNTSAASAAAESGTSVAGTADGDLNDMEKDAVGEVANIVMGSAATALSTLLGKKVEITTPVVELTDPEKFRQDYPLPYVLVNVEYVTGISGANVLIIRDQDACMMVDLMMGGDGQAPPAALDEMHLSAISEAMNQMMGASSTAMSTIIKDRVDISPPTVEVINFATDELKGSLGQKGRQLVKVSFKMTIEGLVDSQIMQLIPFDFAKNMVKNLMDDMAVSGASETVPPVQPVQEPAAPANRERDVLEYAAAAAEPIDLHQPGTHVFEGRQSQGTVKPDNNASPRTGVQVNEIPVQPVQFAPLQADYKPKDMGNIDLIMDVPLQITVELGKTKKTIREILALGSGSVVELDKLAGEPVDLLVNGKLLAKGEVVVIDENFGIRVTDIISPIERVTNLQ